MRIKRHIKRVLSTRLLYTFMLIGAQATLLFYAFSQLTVFKEIQLAFNAFSAVLAFRLVSKFENSAYKLSWIIIILLLPAFGAILYLFFGNKAAGKPFFKRIRQITYKGTLPDLEKDDAAVLDLKQKDADAARIAEYLSNTSKMPLKSGCSIKFLKTGEEWFEHFLNELNKAEEFIFLEFFIIAEGEMWDKTLEVLTKKVKSGVDVRVIYDDVGSVKTLPWGYYKKLEALHIKARAFNKLVPVLSIRHNNRDHRKICVVDGKTAFTGGMNIADEYINKTQPFGHWHDNGIMIKGSCVDNMTAMFLAAWEAIGKDTDEKQPSFANRYQKDAGDAFCLPFTTNPFSKTDVAANVFLQLISRAKDHIYISTPYFIIDFTMQQALITAAQSGIDVRIILPGIPDKPLLYELAHCFFKRLTQAGVKIYIYTPGFMHAKMCESDDTKSLVGSINLDFRSLYLHFENACFIYDRKTASDIKSSFFELFEKCRLVKAEDIQKENVFKKAVRAVFLPFAPLI